MMKRMIEFEKKHNKNKITIEKYFVYFIKFISCVIPNLEFDYTMSS